MIKKCLAWYSNLDTKKQIVLLVAILLLGVVSVAFFLRLGSHVARAFAYLIGVIVGIFSATEATKIADIERKNRNKKIDLRMEAELRAEEITKKEREKIDKMQVEIQQKQNKTQERTAQKLLQMAEKNADRILENDAKNNRKNGAKSKASFQKLNGLLLPALLFALPACAPVGAAGGVKTTTITRSQLQKIVKAQLACESKIKKTRIRCQADLARLKNRSQAALRACFSDLKAEQKKVLILKRRRSSWSGWIIAGVVSAGSIVAITILLVRSAK